MNFNFLNEYRSIAVVGVSNKLDRPSNEVARYLIKNGFTVFMVNPLEKNVLGQTCYPKVQDLPQSVDIVDIFRRKEHALEVVEDAIESNAKVIWMQLGVVNEVAAKKATDLGLTVVMDKCIKIEHQNLIDQNNK